MNRPPFGRSLLGTSLLAALVGSAPAQDLSITDANLSFQVEFNATSTVHASITEFLRADPNGDPAGVLFETSWAYRIDNDTRERIFNDGNGQATFSASGNVGTGTWADVDARGLISATVTYTARSTGASSGYVVGEMAITNISANPITLDLFHLADLDITANYTANYTTTGANGNQRFWVPAVNEFGSHGAVGYDNWEVGGYNNVSNPSGGACTYTSLVDLYNRLQNTTRDTLRNDACLWGPVDVRGAYQWSGRVLPPNQSEVFVVALGHNIDACPASESLYGTSIAGAAGPPTIGSAGGALLGANFAPTIDNCPAGAPCYVLLGLAPASIALNGFTIQTLPDLGILGMTADSFGHAEAMPGIPVPVRPALCGVSVYGQGIVTDLTSTSGGGLPFTHTTGIRWRIGSFR